MSYLVFARKYRPQSFEDVYGQEHVATTLKNALAHGRLGHAYLFSGPRGVGKTTMARLLAKAVNCLVSPGANPCGQCEACKGIAAGGDVDVLEIDAASNRKVEEVEPLIDAARYLPQRSPKKVFIVDEAHMLSKHAWNALLKTLEEPPPHVLFIFATTEPEKVLPTVRSRCQCFDFRSIGAADIERKLHRIADAEGLVLGEGVLAEIAARSTGGLRDAESLLDQLGSAAAPGVPVEVADLVALLGDTPRDVRRRILEQAHRGAMRETLAVAEEIVGRGADALGLLRDLYGDLHGIAVARACGEEGEPGLEWCLAAAEIVARHVALAERSRAPRATLDLALLSVARLGDVRDLEEMVERLERLSGGAPAADDAGGVRGPERRLPRPATPGAPAPPPARTAPPPSSAAPATVGPGRAGTARPGLRLELPGRKEPLEARPARPENEASLPSPGATFTGEELDRVRALPQVREALRIFGGFIEQVGRTEDGEVVR
ncbi:MAG TPA: DNA polymerase III subunit gamma/tau [Planctomycetota bacterium]|nr:DNA polymerase III subunit gamma/tau [Planctomycetota bacterium]